MAVSVTNAWLSVLAAEEPNGSPTISATTNGLVVLWQTAEFPTGYSVTNMQVGGQDYTGSDTMFWESGGSGDGHIKVYWWKQDKIDLFSGTTIGYSDDVVLSKAVWSLAVFDGVNQTTPVTSSDGPSTGDVNTVDISTSSTASDYDVVGIYRSTGNRSISDWDNLTSQWSWSTDMLAVLAHGTGGDSTISIVGDGINDDLSYIHLIINAADAASGLAAEGGAGRGILNGVLRGVT